MEVESAMSAEEPESAFAHLILARMHRERRQQVAQASLNDRRRQFCAPILRADKEA